MKNGKNRPRLLIFIVAYYAESTLTWVLDRIPPEVFSLYDCEVLVVDDASEDRTFAHGRKYQESHPDIRMTVLRNSYNQGYGGNQKVGYSYAIAENFDFVAMLHGDGQYAPEDLPRLVEPLQAGRADAVFGSRMLTPGSALRGGMPFYKYVGNRVLTFLQNLFLGSRLSEFHSGYRVYSVNALKNVPFTLNANDFHFDTEIIIQFLNARYRIVELPIPTHYGDEVCRVHGLSYAGHVLLATARNCFHRVGLLYQRRFDAPRGVPPRYALKLGYPSSHSMALDAVPASARVLNIGGGYSDLSREMAAKGCRVTLLDLPGVLTEREGVKCIARDLDEPGEIDVSDCDCILMLDIIEHLKNPERFIENLRRGLDHRPRTLILTTPNVAFLVPRLMLLVGQFNYAKEGILDMTHMRLFTFRSINRLLRDAGFRIRRVRGIPAPFPKALGDGKLARLLVAINCGLIRLWRNLFSYQIFIECTSTPTVDFVLRDAKSVSAARPRTD